MSNLGVGGLLDLAVVLASGFMLCRIGPIRIRLQRQPAPVPYFTFLACGVAWWMIIPALISMLTSACELLDGTLFSRVCMPTVGNFLDGFVNDGSWRVVDKGNVPSNGQKADVFFSAVFVWILWPALSFMGVTLNRILPKREIVTQICEKVRKRHREQMLRRLELEGQELEKMICKSIISEEILLMLTLRNRKVYIGLPNQLFPDESGHNDRWIKIIPLRSGYRDEETGGLTLTTDYKSALRGEVEWREAEDIAMCIPLRDIVSCQFYSPDLYSRFRADQFREIENSASGGEGGGERTSGELVSSVASSPASR